MKYFLPILIALSALAACGNEDELYTEPDAMLRFSVDTLRFDTVFTQLGSATRSFKIYNPYDETVIINSIRVEGQTAGKFRINVDGLPVDGATSDIRVLPNDSIYVFGEVTIDPDAPLSVSPFVIEDRIVFETNGNEQTVYLEAFGQNANYLPGRFFGDSIVTYAGNFSFDDPKPYVIYGIVLFASGTITMPAGAQIYVHGGVTQFEFDPNEPPSILQTGLILFGPQATLKIEGTLEEPVVIQTDRLEPEFDDIASQWVGLRLQGKNNSIEYATIKNSVVGVYLDSTAELSIKNTQIFHTGSTGLFADFANVSVENSLFHSNGGSAVTIIHGGDYDFSYTTLASYGVDASALTLSNGICYDGLLCESFDIKPLKVDIKNSIVFGSRADEISLGDFTGGQEPSFFDLSMENTIVRVRDLIDPDELGSYPDFFTDICDPCFNATNQDALFVDPSENDYRLDTLSIAEGYAVPLNIATDLVGNPRDADNPDAGAYEYLPE